MPSRNGFLRRAVGSLGLWSTLAVLVLAFLGLELLESAGGAEGLRQRFGLAAMLPLILVHALASVSPFPGELIAFGNSMLFGFRLGVVCNWSGWMLAAIIQYGLVRRAANDLVLHEVSWWKNAPNWLRTLPVEHPLFLICGRWLPFGGHLVNTSAGLLPVHFWRHVWCAAISILPVAVLVAALGSGAVSLLVAPQ